jgi:hypothetical protein
MSCFSTTFLVEDGEGKALIRESNFKEAAGVEEAGAGEENPPKSFHSSEGETDRAVVG